MGVDGVAQPAAQRGDQALELGVGEGVAAAAGAADGVVMMVSARIGRLVAGDAVDIDAMDQPQLREDVERAVDRRQSRSPLAIAELLVDVLGADAAALLGEQLHDGAAGTAAAVSGVREDLRRVFGPLALIHCPAAYR